MSCYIIAPVDRVDGITKWTSKDSSDGSNCSDGELWLGSKQKRFSRRSKGLNKQGQMKKAQSVVANLTKPKPEVKPKPKNKLIASRIRSIEKSFSHDDRRLQSESAGIPLGMQSCGDGGHR